MHVVFILLLSDGVMCALTAVTWILQRLVVNDYIDWNTTGWLLQHVSTL